MRLNLLLAGLVATIPSSALAATTLPEACGSAEAKFNVQIEKSATVPSSMDDGKAHIVFIETFVKPVNMIGGDAIIRFGFDGAWSGAAKRNSYFTVSLPAGEHHLCAAWQSNSRKLVDQNMGLAALKVEAGKTYYMQYRIEASEAGEFTNFSRINEDQAKFFLKTYDLAIATGSQ